MVSRNDADLLSCLRWDAVGDARLAALDGPGWTALLGIVEAGRGEALLTRRIARAGIVPPAAITAALARAAKALALRNMAGTASLLRALAAFERPVLLLKGVDIAQRVYGNLAQRRMGDIDILVRPEDVAACHAALIAGGYTTERPPTAFMLSGDRYMEAQYAAPQPRQLPVELHWRLTAMGLGREIDLDGIWARAQPLTQLGGHARVMAPEDLLLYLCVHIRHHAFDVPLTHLWDIAELMVWAGGGFDWPLVWRRARDWRLVRTLQLVFRQLETTLGVPAPAPPDAPAIPASVRLPDVMANLGLHPDHAGMNYRHVAAVFTAGAPATERAATLWRALFPPRADVAERLGVAPGSWRSVAAYPAHWLAMAWRRRGLIGHWLRRDPKMRQALDQRHTLLAWLDGE